MAVTCRVLNIARLRSPDPEKVAAHLRTNNMIVACDRHAWTVDAETASYTLNSSGSFFAATAKILAQQDEDQAKHE